MARVAHIASICGVWLVACLGLHTEPAAPQAGMRPLQNTGTHFIVTFLGNATHAPQLVVIGDQGDVIHEVTVRLPLHPEYDARIVMEDMGSHRKYTFPPEVRLRHEGVSSKGIEVLSAKPVTLFGIEEGHMTSDGYLALPVSSLGQHYVTSSCACAMAHTHLDESADLGCVSYIGIVAQFSNTTIQLTVPDDLRGYVTSNVKSRDGTPGYDVILGQYETWLIRSSRDVMGVMVTSSHPVSVFTGNDVTMNMNSAWMAHVTSQLPPIGSWGTKYITAPSPGVDTQDQLCVIASARDTVVTTHATPGGERVHELEKNRPHHCLNITATELVSLSASQPVLVMQCSRGQKVGRNSSAGFGELETLAARDIIFSATVLLDRQSWGHKYTSPHPAEPNRTSHVTVLTPQHGAGGGEGGTGGEGSGGGVIVGDGSGGEGSGGEGSGGRDGTKGGDVTERNLEGLVNNVTKLAFHKTVTHENTSYSVQHSGFINDAYHLMYRSGNVTFYAITKRFPLGVHRQAAPPAGSETKTLTRDDNATKLRKYRILDKSAVTAVTPVAMTTTVTSSTQSTHPPSLRYAVKNITSLVSQFDANVKNKLMSFHVELDKDAEDQVINLKSQDHPAGGPFHSADGDGSSLDGTVIAVLLSLGVAVFFVILCVLGFSITEVLRRRRDYFFSAKVSPYVD